MLKNDGLLDNLTYARYANNYYQTILSYVTTHLYNED